jgi:dTDP-4-dehydrorhamnose reductase
MAAAMKKVLVLGGSGMLGHKVWQLASERTDAYATIRAERLSGPAGAILRPERTITGVSAEEPETVSRALDESGAELVVNCVGIVKQDERASDPVASIEVNSLFPHRLAHLCASRGVRVVQISTDCVFSGRQGDYSETDTPDPEDLYGRSKLLGEIDGEGCLTFRTSIIGRELERALGLVEWFLAQRGGEIRGFTRAVFSGLTTGALAQAILDLADRHPDLHGIWHLASEPITKHDLLVALRDAYGLDVVIDPDDSVVIDRSLSSARLTEATGWSAPAWADMIDGLVSDPTPYDELRNEPTAG